MFERSRKQNDETYKKLLRRITFYFWVLCAAAFMLSGTAAAQELTVKRLLPGRTILGEIAGDQKHLYEVTLRSGEFMQVRLEQKGVDLALSIYTTEGKRLAHMNSPNGKDGLEVLTFIPERAGLYGILVGRMKQESNAKAGKYSIVLEAGRAATERDRRRVEAERQFVAINEHEYPAANLQPLIERYERLLDAYRGAADEHLIRIIEKRLADLKGYTSRVAADVAARNREAEEEANRRAAAERRRAKEVANANLPQLIVPTGHSNGIGATAFSPDGRILASAGADNIIKLWDVKTGHELRTLIGHDRTIYSIAFSPNGRTLASASGDYTVKLWDITSGRLLSTLSGHTSYVISVAFSPDGRTLASASWDYTVKLWDTGMGQELRALASDAKQAVSVAFTPDGNILVGGSIDKSIKLWDTRTGRELRRLPEAGASSNVYQIALSPDGRIVASGGDDNAVRLWDVASGQLLRTLSGHSGYVNRVAFSPDGRTLASGSNDKTVKLWEVSTGQALYTLSERVASVTFSPNGQILATGGGISTVKFWEVNTGRALRTLSSPTESIYHTVFSPDGHTLASAGQGKTVRLWDKTSGQMLRPLSGHSESIFSLAFSPDGRVLASGSEDKTVKVWEVNTGRALCSLSGHTGTIRPVIFSPDGRTLASGSNDNTVKLWDPGTCRELRTLKGHSGIISALAFSPDGRILASGGGDRSVRLWEVGSGREVRTLAGHSSFVVSVAFSPDGRTLASGSSEAELRYKQLPKGDSSIKLWDVNTGRELNTISKNSEYVYLLAFSPDGRALASRNFYALTMLWNIGTGQEMKMDKFPRWYATALKDVISTGNGKLLRAEAQGAAIIMRDADTEDEFAQLVAFDNDDWLVITPDGFFDGTNKSWQRLKWRFNNNTFETGAVEFYFSDFFYPGLLQEIFDGNPPRAPSGRELDKIDRRQPGVEIAVINGQTKTQLAAQAATGERTATLIIEVTDNTEGKRQADHQEMSGAQDLRLFRNSSLVKVWHGDVFGLDKDDKCEQINPAKPNGPRRVRCRAEVPIIAGANNFTAYAFNSGNVKSNDDTVTIKGADSLKRAGTLFVIAIGVGQYENPQYNLNYTVADALVFGEEIKRRQEQVKQYERVEVVSLLNDHAKKATILATLKKLADAMQPEDGVIVYFSGHGTAQGNRFYLIPHDLGYQGRRDRLDAQSLRAILAHSISDRELEEAFEKIDAGRILLVIDACNSGQALDAEEKRRGPMNSKGLAQLAYEKGMYVLTASQSVELAFESEALKHSYMTYALVEEGLKSKVGEADLNSDGQVWLREWFDYTVQRVPLMRAAKVAQTANRRNKALEEESERGKVQTPRVFYRREADLQPWIVANSK